MGAIQYVVGVYTALLFYRSPDTWAPRVEAAKKGKASLVAALSSLNDSKYASAFEGMCAHTVVQEMRRDAQTPAREGLRQVEGGPLARWAASGCADAPPQPPGPAPAAGAEAPTPAAGAEGWLAQAQLARRRLKEASAGHSQCHATQGGQCASDEGEAIKTQTVIDLENLISAEEGDDGCLTALPAADAGAVEEPAASGQAAGGLLVRLPGLPPGASRLLAAVQVPGASLPGAEGVLVGAGAEVLPGAEGLLVAGDPAACPATTRRASEAGAEGLLVAGAGAASKEEASTSAGHSQCFTKGGQCDSDKKEAMETQAALALATQSSSEEDDDGNYAPGADASDLERCLFPMKKPAAGSGGRGSRRGGGGGARGRGVHQGNTLKGLWSGKA